MYNFIGVNPCKKFLKILERSKNEIIKAIPNADINVQFTFADEGGKT